MSRVVAGDFTRQAANVARANFHVAVTTAAGATIQDVKRRVHFVRGSHRWDGGMNKVPLHHREVGREVAEL